MRVRTIITTALLLLASQTCQARSYTLEEADVIIVMLLLFVILLLVLGGVSLYYNRIISQRNEKLRRILNGLEAYREMMDDKPLAILEQKEEEPESHPKTKTAKVAYINEGQKLFVEMDARMTKEKPFTDPSFDHQSLIRFLGVEQEAFCMLMPRYSNPGNTISYINSRRAEYGAQLIMEHPDYTMNDIAAKCGFKNIVAFTNAFKFAFGITPSDYMNGMNQMFKKNDSYRS